jgi:hypothetical protein
MRGYALFLTAALAGCVMPESKAPSLAPRAAEAIDPRLPVPEPQLPMAADPSLASQLAALVALAEAGDSSFRNAAPAARQAAGSAGARESESWVVAQQLLSALIATRAPVTGALGDIDALGAARIERLGGIAAADIRAIRAAAGRVAEIDRRQAELIDELQARLR